MSAAELKAQGNTAFQAQKFEEAIDFFSQAIELDADNHVLYSNRSASYCSLQQYDKALEDANLTIEKKPDWAKGYGRKGAALIGKGDPVSALEAYEEGLKLDATNSMLLDGKKDCENRIRARSSTPSDSMMQIGALFTAPGAIDKLRADPKTAPLFADPSFVARLELVRSNPAMVMQNFDQNMLTCMGVLMGKSFGFEDGEGDAMDTKPDAAEEAPQAAEPKQAEPTPAPEASESEEAEPVDPEAAAAKEKAAACKAKGTEAYKAKNFDEALKLYQEAADLDPTDMVFHLNLGAVHMEVKDFDKAIASCHKAVEVGMDNRADYKTIAKAYARIGKACFLQSKWEDSVTAYQKALANHRNRDYLNMQKKAEQKLKEAQRLAYIDPEKSMEAKQRGNDFFKADKYPEAIREYSDAIKRNPDDGKLYSNRAAAYTKLMEYSLALKDCDECIRLEPNFIKGYLRKGNIHLALKQASEARKAFETALTIDPNHTEASEGLRKVAVLQSGVGMSREERAKQAMQDPEIQAIMADPVMQTILQQMAEDPKAAQDHFKNPAISDKIQKLAAAGIIGFN